MARIESADYEQTDGEPWLLAILAGGIAAFLVITPIVLMAAFPTALQRTKVTPPSRTSPSPRLQIDPASELDALKVRENVRLSTYGWTDRRHQALRIPIDRAMSLVEQRGLSGWQR
jgi:hypothetical protein